MIEAAGNTAAVSPVGVILVIVITLPLIALYWLPTIVGSKRHVPNLVSIAVINCFLGWTLVGWAIALALAARDIPPNIAPQVREAPQTLPSPRSWE
jgi:RsiW-degrading membrane proteinase PrsW (M82 family)